MKYRRALYIVGGILLGVVLIAGPGTLGHHLGLKGQRSESEQRLQTLASTLVTYAEDHGENFPTSISSLSEPSFGEYNFGDYLFFRGDRVRLFSPRDLAPSPMLGEVFSQLTYLATKDRRRLIVFERPGLWDDHTIAYLEFNLEGGWKAPRNIMWVRPKRITEQQFADYLSKLESPVAAQSPADSLVAAAEHDEEADLRTFLSRGVPIDGQDWRGWTALTMAAQIGRDEVAELLISHGANLNVRDNVGLGRTALMRACIAGNANLVDILLARGADIGVKRNDGNTALMEALPFPRIVRKLIAAGANVNEPVEYEFSRAWSPLIAACSGGYTETARIFIEHGADLRKDLPEALEWAARNGHPEAIQMLLSQGISTDQKVLGELLTSAYAYPEAMKRLISMGADVNTKCAECNGRTVLMLSAVNGYPEAVHFLISAGANPNLKDNKGHTVLDLALAASSSAWLSALEKKRFPEIIDTLRKAGAAESGLKVEWPESW